MRRRKYVNNNPRFIKARYDSICAETGQVIKKNTECLYYPIGKKVFSMDSTQVGEWKSQQQADSYGLLDANW